MIWDRDGTGEGDGGKEISVIGTPCDVGCAAIRPGLALVAICVVRVI